MANRLAQATSPYLQQHAANPVWWFEWGEDAFKVAKEKDLPIFLSIGYSACHWCHVMAHESFENKEVADYLNENFICIKVDREERPEVDNVYMQATIALTGHGGWPMSVFLDHELKPFYAGTYFPPEPKGGQVSFSQLLIAIVDTWANRRIDLNQAADRLSQYLVEKNLPQKIKDSFDESTLNNAAIKLVRQFDPINHGFGASPKFPPSMALEFLLRSYARTLNPDLLELVEFTCYSMSRGGMYDQLAGGFARYSVDAHWTIPHFEKMLYDNALLIGVYARFYRIKPIAYFKRIVEETVDWIDKEMLTPEGAFAAALDADSEGEEGRFYVFNQAEILKILEPDDAQWAMHQFEITESGSFENGFSVLQRRKEPDDLARYEKVKNLLKEYRENRIRPQRDDKIVLSWNCWLISNLIDAGKIFKNDNWVELALSALDFLLENHRSGEELYRVSKNGITNQIKALLEDYASLITACFKAHAATGDTKYLFTGENLVKTMLRKFTDGENFFDSEISGDINWIRSRDDTDNAYPSALSLAAEALISAGAFFNRIEWITLAENLVNQQIPKIEAAPRFAAHFLTQMEALWDGPLEIAVVGNVEDEAASLIWQSPRAGWIMSIGEAGETPLLENRQRINGQATVYVCKNFTCHTPITDLTQLQYELKIVQN